MTMLSREEAKAVLDKVLGYSKAEGCEANLDGSTTGNIRYARNTVSTAGSVTDLSLVVQSNFGKRMATATINELDDASLAKVVRRSEELARLAPENPEFVEVLGPQEYLETRGYFESTAGIEPAFRADVAAASIEPCREKKLVAAGYLEDTAGFSAMANSKGLFAYYPATGIDFSVTVRTADGTGSGYVTRDYNDVSLFDAKRASAVAIAKAEGSRQPRAIEPGKYTVVLEPAASVGLLRNMMFNFDRRQADEGRSFLAKPGGGVKVGEKIVDERVTMYSDPTVAEIPTAPWADDGRRRERVTWIEKGVVKNLFCERYWAREKEVPSIPFPANGVMAGGEASLDELVAATRRGILVTRTWYIRTVDPQTLLYTGLTRDGTFFIEDGKIAFPIKNMRFNESPVIMLNNIEALGRPERINGSLIPPMKIRDFTFSSLSDAV
ncbi:MAG: TldD/PmbA family protein [Acidobacteriota bacterium]|nr:TldD/PmbA family protein [Acidobacteriota bacterium]MDH3525148.1 TldD/PmbA family protein [Acidobacteriota bacterium]